MPCMILTNVMLQFYFNLVFHNKQQILPTDISTTGDIPTSYTEYFGKASNKVSWLCKPV